MSELGDRGSVRMWDAAMGESASRAGPYPTQSAGPAAAWRRCSVAVVPGRLDQQAEPGQVPTPTQAAQPPHERGELPRASLHMSGRPSRRSQPGMTRGRPGSGTAKAQHSRALTPASPRSTPTDDHPLEETATSPFRPRSRGRRPIPSSTAVPVRRTHE